MTGLRGLAIRSTRVLGKVHVRCVIFSMNFRGRQGFVGGTQLSSLRLLWPSQGRSRAGMKQKDGVGTRSRSL